MAAYPRPHRAIAEDRVSLARPSLEATAGTTLAVGLLIPDSFSASAYPAPGLQLLKFPLGPCPRFEQLQNETRRTPEYPERVVKNAVSGAEGGGHHPGLPARAGLTPDRVS